MPTYKDVAIVVRTHKLGETDRIVTMLTRGRGKVRAVAKGVRRTKSRFGARLEPGMVVELQCYEGRSLDTVTQAEMIAPYGDHISRDYPAFTAATAMLETADRLSEEHEPVVQQFNLLAGGLAALAGRTHPIDLVLDSYLLRAVSIAGWAPTFVNCAGCGAAGPHRAFNLAAGGAVCYSCRTPGSSAPDPRTFELLAALLSGDWEQAERSDERARREADGLVAAYLQWHLERGVRSLRLVDHPVYVASPVPPAVGVALP
ncbi:DNA repair protein RecO [Allobranchiibius sp. CTAmp26]|uniref:DNA repair protein RecO n=1 Tax=Allobranchiibius sp. CTAmp26 TaxID=2815214 RepID=UPI001AA0BB12|nr:DNA repair protein RecO [Allobranchiibius sp. CTAmp26]MBO1754736.1 DNA repair protein RecO [Allobranchiibius sp. CTAmp26]